MSLQVGRLMLNASFVGYKLFWVPRASITVGIWRGRMLEEPTSVVDSAKEVRVRARLDFPTEGASDGP